MTIYDDFFEGFSESFVIKGLGEISGLGIVRNIRQCPSSWVGYYTPSTGSPVTWPVTW
jgi:hypothetical protein